MATTCTTATKAKTTQTKTKSRRCRCAGLKTLCLAAFGLFCFYGYIQMKSDGVRIAIVHTNDVHAHIEEFDAYGSECTEELKSKGQCYGGISRQKWMVNRIRARNPNNTIFLNAGDYSQGSMWFFLFRQQMVVDAMKILEHDVFTLGNHEFDHGPAGIAQLLNSIKSETNTTVVGCNVDFSKDPILKDLQLRPSVVLERANARIGVIGYTTPETKFLSMPGDKIEFKDEIECIRQEADRLKAEGVNIIIAVGHSGYSKDQDIADHVRNVSVVVGGHTNTYLASVRQPTSELPKGAYPTIIEREDGSKALVVQDYWLGKYLGFLEIVFDPETGSVKSWDGDAPIVLDQSIPQDPEAERMLAKKKHELEKKSAEILGVVPYMLSGEKHGCKRQECAFGNMLADALIEYLTKKNLTLNAKGKHWRNIDMAVVNGGGIRGTITRGNVTYSNVVSISPFDTQLEILVLSGKAALQMFEFSASKFPNMPSDFEFGGFLQVSGAELIYDLSQKPMQRIFSARVLTKESGTPPHYVPIDANATYQVAMSRYIANGGDGHKFKIIRRTLANITDTSLLRDFFSQRSLIYPRVEGRIRYMYTNRKVTKADTTKNPCWKFRLCQVIDEMSPSLLDDITSFLIKHDNKDDGSSKDNQVEFTKTSPKALAIDEAWAQQIREIKSKPPEILGSLAYTLSVEDQECHLRECPLGNLLTDAVMEHFIREATNSRPDAEVWRDVDMVVLNAGGFVGTLKAGSLTHADAMSVFPVKAGIDILVLSGSTVLQMLEYSVAQFDDSHKGFAGFLHISGGKLIFDLTRPRMKRLLSAMVLTKTVNNDPVFVPIQPKSKYNIAMPDYLADGEVGYSFKSKKKTKGKVTNIEALRKYITTRTLVSPRPEGRIRFVSGTSEIKTAKNKRLDMCQKVCSMIDKLESGRFDELRSFRNRTTAKGERVRPKRELLHFLSEDGDRSTKRTL